MTAFCYILYSTISGEIADIQIIWKVMTEVVWWFPSIDTFWQCFQSKGIAPATDMKYAHLFCNDSDIQSYIFSSLSSVCPRDYSHEKPNNLGWHTMTFAHSPHVLMFVWRILREVHFITFIVQTIQMHAFTNSLGCI